MNRRRDVYEVPDHIRSSTVIFFLPRRKSNSESKSKKGSEERCAFEDKSASVHPPVRNRLLFPSDGTETLVVMPTSGTSSPRFLKASRTFFLVIHPAVEIHFMQSPK